MGYPTTAELIAASSGAAREALDALDEPQLEELRSSAIAAVEAFTRQSFTVEGSEADPVSKAVNGTGTDRVYLPRRLAILDAVQADGYVLAEGDYLRADNGESITLVSPIGGSWLTRVRRPPGDPGPVFHRGAGNVVVSGVWGWTDAEWLAGALDPVATAIRYDMEDQAQADANKLAGTVRSLRGLGVESMSQGSLSLTLRPGESALSMRAQRTLLPFRFTGRVGGHA